jgi:hypothetical protein
MVPVWGFTRKLENVFGIFDLECIIKKLHLDWIASSPAYWRIGSGHWEGFVKKATSLLAQGAFLFLISQ